MAAVLSALATAAVARHGRLRRVVQERQYRQQELRLQQQEQHDVGRPRRR